MRNYDFHELLSFDEFQRFATELLSIKEDVKLRCNPIGKDGGVDFYSLDNSIMGQVKNYKNSFSSLKSSLKDEIIKVKNEKPKRYILVTATSCTKKNKEELVSMFEGYLNYEDILDKNELNLLLGLEKYNHLEIEYLKLLVPNSFVLSYFLDKIQYKSIYTQTEIELEKIKSDQKVFSSTESFFEALNKLLNNKAILISGEAGIGKSILGRMLSAYLINSNPDSQFISVKSIDELYQIYNSSCSQIYFFDDFWGDIEYNFQINSVEQKRLLDFIDYINKSDNKWLILTSREYILNEGVELNNQWSKKFLSYKFSLTLDSISMISKFNILFNHLKISDLSWKHLNIVLRFWRNIVDNSNYNPRLIETFLNNYDNYRDLDDFDFFKQFEHYLDSPYEYWKNILTKQSFLEIVLLIFIALNESDMSVKELNKRFDYIVHSKHLERNLTFSFVESIKKMEDTFTVTKLRDEVCIELKNPSYRDFILDYFSKNISTYISYIYYEELSNEELINLWGVINKDFELYKDLEEVHKLDKLLFDKIRYSNDKLYYLVQLASKTTFGYNSILESYLIGEVTYLIRNMEDLIYFDIDSYDRSFDLLQELYMKYDFKPYLDNMLNTILFDSDNFYSIEKLVIIKNLYPDIFKIFFKEYRMNIKSCLCECAINDAYYYEENKDMIGIEYLCDEYVPEVFGKLGIKVPKKLNEKLNAILDSISESLPSIPSDYKPSKLSRPKQNKNDDLKIIDKKIESLIGTNEYISDINKVLKEKKYSSKVRKIINNIEDKDIDIFNNLIHYRNTLNLMCDFIENDDFSYDIVNFLDDFIYYIRKKNNIDEDTFEDMYTLAFLLINDKKVLFTEEDFKSYGLDITNLDSLLNCGLFVKRNKWYHFTHPIIHLYLVLFSFRRFNKAFNLHIILERLEGFSYEWREINYHNFNEILIYKLLKKMFPDIWHKQIEISYLEYFIEKIDNSNEIEIAKSILKVFSFILNYDEYGLTCYIYRAPIVLDLIRLIFDIDLLELFNLANVNDEMEEFLDKFINTDKDFEVSSYLNRKKFIDLLVDNGIVDTLNKLYNEVNNYLEEEVVIK